MRNLLSWIVGRPTQKVGGDLPSVRQLNELKGRRVLLRASLNAPVEDGEVTETFRLEQALSTIDFLKKRGARVIVVGHIGREPKESLEPVHRALSKMTNIAWGGSLEEASASVASLGDGEAILLENLRQDERESAGDTSLAKELAAFADIYVNDAFSDSHREHVSITGVPAYLPSCFGDGFLREYKELKKAMQPEHPSLFILGGAKFETKMPLVERYAAIYDVIYVAGALANDIYKAKGYEVGSSLVSDIDLSKNTIIEDPKIMVPGDVVVEDGDGKKEVGVRAVLPEESILDIGPVSLKELDALVSEARTILWNGPLGNFEKGFSMGTEMLAQSIARSNAFSVVGGGDTIAAIRSLGLTDRFGFMSTAGGAMLVFLETGTLPGIEAVLKNPIK